MKKTMLLVALLYAGVVCAQQIPTNAKTFFDKKYPTAESVSWTETSEGYQVEFETDIHSPVATFNKQGAWLETRTYLEEEEIPSPIQSWYYEKHADGSIESAEKLERKDGTYYELTIEEDEDIFLFTFSKEGKVLKTIKLAEVEENDEEEDE